MHTAFSQACYALSSILCTFGLFFKKSVFLPTCKISALRGIPSIHHLLFSCDELQTTKVPKRIFAKSALRKAPILFFFSLAVDDTIHNP